METTTSSASAKVFASMSHRLDPNLEKSVYKLTFVLQ
jgi:hypothetical protein